ncbi:MAG: DUF1565 domain-containing protein [Xenococcaceae cyanobacterium MO_188.B19]|nr:DUF1565 domain-containing protein [Xenococcaceae cyanobacterium MO_188.B19]
MRIHNSYWFKRHHEYQINQWGFFLAALIPLSLGSILIFPNPSTAQPSQIQQQQKITARSIYVNPQRGKDSASGYQATPLKTITQALRIAEPNTTIYLAAGTYSEATGEVFPLIIKNNITLEGNPPSKGYKTVIKGSGSFISPTGAGQNVTIAAIKNAGGIKGITVTNPHTRGHGLWIESANPEVTHNTFTHNGNTGLSVNGNSSPIIANNYFYRNLGNGLLIYGTSTPQVIENEFDHTGFGVSAVKSAAPTLVRNSFTGNRISVIFEGNSQGILRGNKINNSTEYGLVAIANSRVDLGTTKESGDNTFDNNRKFDIQNITNNPIPALGTEVAGKIDGNIDFSGKTKGVQIAANRTVAVVPQPSSNRVSRLRRVPLKERSTPPKGNNIGLSTSAIGNGETLPPPPEIKNPASRELVFSAPNENIAPKKDILPVPNIEPPVSRLTSSGGNRQINSLSDVLSASNSSSSRNVAQVNYRVLVEVGNNKQKRRIKSLYPGAFSTTHQGKSMLQIGAFRDRTRAENTSRSLTNLGLNSHILSF